MALAEALGAIDRSGGGGRGAGLAYQAIGSSTATLRRDPRPRRARRRLAGGPGRHQPAAVGAAALARAVATLVVVDGERTATAEEADAFVELDAARDFEALWALRALVAGAPLDRDRAGELPLDDLAERLRAARHVAFLHGALDELEALALLSLVRDLSRDRHAVTLALRGEGNARGAEDVLAWQTGFPAAVSFARGHPRANPGEFSAAALLERGEVDAALVDRLRRARAAAGACASCRRVVVDARDTETARAARVAFATAADGIEVAGTVAPHGRRARPAARAARRRPRRRSRTCWPRSRSGL